METRPPLDDGPSELEDLLAACIELADAGRERELAEVYAAHPEHAAELRQLLGSLEELGMVDALEETPDGERLGEYRLLRKLGAGGMGTVYLARQESLRRLVALKVVHPALAVSPTARERFRREAQAIARLSHPSIVRVYGAGEDAGRLYYAMEYVPGRDLRTLLEDETRPELPELVRWTRDVARALQAAHEAGVVHRDVKPSNILVTSDGEARLLDFGLAHDEGAESLTASGGFQGSPHYAAPEQVAGRRGAVGPRTDVYGLGVTLYEGLVGERPFDGDSTQQVFHAILHTEPAPLRERARHLPRDLEVVVAKAMERAPERRYASARELADDLTAVLEYRPIRARPAGPLRRAVKWSRRNRLSATLAAALVVVALGTAGAVLVQRELSARDRERREQDLLDERARVARESEERADELVALVDGELTRLAATRADELARVDRVAELERSLHEREGDLVAWSELDREQAELELVLRTRRTGLARLEARLAEAEQLFPAQPELAAARARLHLEHLFLARALGEEMAAAYFVEQVASSDPEGRLRDEVDGVTPVSITTDPPGARVHLFRYRDGRELGEGVGARLVAVPLRGPVEGVPPGGWALRPVEGHPQLERTDTILSIAGRPVGPDVYALDALAPVRRGDRLVGFDGAAVDSPRVEERLDPAAARPHAFAFASSVADGDRVVEATALRALGLRVGDARALVAGGSVEVEVHRAGERLALELESGVETRLTASPLLVGPESALGDAPVSELRLPEGPYVALLVAEGRPPARVPFDVVAGSPVTIDVALPAEAPPAPGFVPVLRTHTGAAVPFWILDREVTLADYLEFLNDPATRAEIDGAARPPYVPREFDAPGSYIQRTPDGAWHVPWHYTAETPAMGLCYLDGEAYCAWLNRRSEESGEPWVYALPSQEEVDAVRLVSRHRTWVNGTSFRPHFVQSKLAGGEMALEPTLRYPIDEYPHGVFDLSGGLYEWSRSWFDEPNRIRRIYGGVWHQDLAAQFRSDAWHSSSEHTPTGSYGFRLVARRRD